jgi:hypothetical protein
MTRARRPDASFSRKRWARGSGMYTIEATKTQSLQPVVDLILKQRNAG